jgi:pyrroline-5-carboxylate reductase
MGEAFIGALINTGLARPDQIRVTDIRTERCGELESTYGIAAGQDNRALFLESDIIIIAVKPQQAESLLQEIAPAGPEVVPGRKLVISIAAGVRIHTFETHLYAALDEDTAARLPVIRVMPNTPALVLAGMSGMSPNAHANEDDRAKARRLLEAMGKVLEFNEADLDAVTALSGSGPAYVFYLAESMIQGGVAAGLNEEHARILALQTLHGAVRLLNESGDSPESLRRKVTSPGGTTEAALGVMESNAVKGHIVSAIVAAARRAEELSG